MTPERIEKAVAEFRELVAEAKLLREGIQAAADDLRGLLEKIEAANKETRRLQGVPDDETPKRPALELVKSDPAAPEGPKSKDDPC